MDGEPPCGGMLPEEETQGVTRTDGEPRVEVWKTRIFTAWSRSLMGTPVWRYAKEMAESQHFIRRKTR